MVQAALRGLINCLMGAIGAAARCWQLLLSSQLKTCGSPSRLSSRPLACCSTSCCEVPRLVIQIWFPAIHPPVFQGIDFKAPQALLGSCGINLLTKLILTVLVPSPSATEGRVFPFRCCCFSGLHPQTAIPAVFHFHVALCIFL